MAFTRRWGLLFRGNNETDEEVAKRFTDLVDATLSTGMHFWCGHNVHSTFKLDSKF